jgi:hypothetical protein
MIKRGVKALNISSVTRFAIAVFIGCLSACAWVELSEEGESVQVMTEAPVSCERLGQTKSMIKSEIASIDRNREKVAKELQTLARNTAAGMGGDIIVPETEISGAGEQSFGVYRCGR